MCLIPKPLPGNLYTQHSTNYYNENYIINIFLASEGHSFLFTKKKSLFQKLAKDYMIQSLSTVVESLEEKIFDTEPSKIEKQEPTQDGVRGQEL